MSDPNQPSYGSPVPPPPPAYPSMPPADHAAPPGAYQVPVGGYQEQAGAYAIPAPVAKPSSALGFIALACALVAFVVAPVLGAVFGFQIGTLVPEFAADSGVTDLAVLAPAKTQVLWAEIAFWLGTVTGIAGLAVGIAAIVKRRGRGLGITAVVLSVLGAGAFVVATFLAVVFGSAAAVLN